MFWLSLSCHQNNSTVHWIQINAVMKITLINFQHPIILTFQGDLASCFQPQAGGAGSQGPPAKVIVKLFRKLRSLVCVHFHVLIKSIQWSSPIRSNIVILPSFPRTARNSSMHYLFQIIPWPNPWMSKDYTLLSIMIIMKSPESRRSWGELIAPPLRITSPALTHFTCIIVITILSSSSSSHAHWLLCLIRWMVFMKDWWQKPVKAQAIYVQRAKMQTHLSAICPIHKPVPNPSNLANSINHLLYDQHHNNHHEYDHDYDQFNNHHDYHEYIAIATKCTFPPCLNSTPTALFPSSRMRLTRTFKHHKCKLSMAWSFFILNIRCDHQLWKLHNFLANDEHLAFSMVWRFGRESAGLR